MNKYLDWAVSLHQTKGMELDQQFYGRCDEVALQCW